MKAKHFVATSAALGLVTGSAITNTEPSQVVHPQEQSPFSTAASVAVDNHEHDAIIGQVEEQLGAGATTLVVGFGEHNAPAAASLAGNLEAPVFLGDPSVDEVLDLIDSYEVADLYITAHEGTLDDADLDNLEGGVDNLHDAFGSTSLEISAAAVALHPEDAQPMIALAPDDGSQVRATTWAIARSAPVVTYSEAEDEATFAILADNFTEGTIIIFGGLDDVPDDFTTLEWEGQATTYDEDSQPEPWLDDIAAATQAGRNPMNLVVAPSEQPFITQQAAAVAAAHGGIFQPVTADGGFDAPSDALHLLQLAGEERDAIQALGASVSESDVEELLDAATATRASAPDAYVSEATATDDSSTLEVEAPNEVETIEAYDIVGDEIGRTTSSTLELDGQLQALRLVLLNTDGDEIESIEFKTNFVDGDDSAFDVAASENNGTFHIEIGSTAVSPRLVVAHGHNLEDQSVETAHIAVTCETSTSFDNPDPSLQWQIEVHDFAGGDDHPACGEHSFTGAKDLLIGGVSFPATEGSAATTRENGADGRGAQPTFFDELVLNQEEAEEHTTTANIPPIHLRYEAFIEPSSISTPAPGIAQFWVFSGDGRTVHEPGSARLQVNAEATFDGSPPTGNAEIGLTERQTCRALPPSGCTDPRTARSDGDSVSVTGNSTATSADVSISFAEPNPLFPLSPDIDGTAQFTLRLGGSVVSVEHDRMPTHAIWYGAAESHYYLAYTSPSWSLPCLAGWLPGCTVTDRAAI